MCLIAFDWQPNSRRPLTLISNRDEFYQRPSKPAHFWDDHVDIFGGKDLEMGGTWLAISKQGRLAAVTNYRQPDSTKYAYSRGEIPVDFLTSQVQATDWAKSFVHKIDQFAGFNAILYDGNELVYMSNRADDRVQTLGAGLYGLSNHLLNSDWPKVHRAKSALSAHLNTDDAIQLNTRLLNEFQNTHKPDDSELPDTGVGISLERMLSSMFIKIPNYGTRTSTALSVYSNGHGRPAKIHFSEINFEESGLEKPTQHDFLIVTE